MATSNAMGTGRKAAINATATIPMTLTCPVSAGCGMSSTAKASGTAAKIISGNARRKTIQILFAWERATAIKAAPGFGRGNIDDAIDERFRSALTRGRGGDENQNQK